MLKGCGLSELSGRVYPTMHPSGGTGSSVVMCYQNVSCGGSELTLCCYE